MFFKSRASRKLSSFQPRRRGLCVERLEERSLLAVMALKTEALTTDVNGNGRVDPGDTLTYTVSVQNPGGPSASAVSFSDTPDPNTTLVVGSVTTTAGSVTSGNAAGQSSVGVDVGTVGSGANVTIRFRATINNPLPPGITQVSNQGVLSHASPANTAPLVQCFNVRSGNSPVGQEFVPTGERLSYIDLFIEDAGSDMGMGANLQVRLHEGTITGTVVATSLTEFVPDGTNTGGGSIITRFDFASPVTVTPGATYVLEIRMLDPLNTGNLNYAMCGGSLTTSNYADGRAVISGTPRETFDFWFRIGSSQLTDDPNVAGTANPTVTLLGVNSAPQPTGDRYIGLEDTPIVIAAPGVLGNDSDPNGDPLTAVLVSGPTRGMLNFAADGSFTYTPNANFFGLDSFTYQASDGQLFSPNTLVSLDIRSVNDPPVLGDATFTLAENSPVGTLVGTLMASDVEGQQLFYFIESGNESGAFALDMNTGALTVANSAPLDFETTPQFNLVVRVRDFGQASSTANVRINLTNVNQNPTLPGATFSLAENSPAATPVGAVAGADPDGDALTYAIIGGNAAGAFAINPATGAIAVASSTPLDFETTPQFNLTVEARDPGGLAATAAVVVNLTNVNETPALVGAAFTLAENSPAGTAVGSVAGTDPDGDALTYAIVGGNAAGAFAINPATGAIAVANSAPLDFETTPQFNLTVEARDPGGLAATAAVVIDLLDRPELSGLMIDIRPGDGSNTINIKSHGKVDVAIYSTPGFDVMDLDVASLTFGRTGDEDSLSRNPHGPRYRYTDLNGDGLLDLVATFEIELTGLVEGDGLGILKARTLGGSALMGSDVVLIKSPGN